MKHTKGKIDHEANVVNSKVNIKLNLKIFPYLFLIKDV